MTHIWEWNGTGRADWEGDELEGIQSPAWSQCPPCYVGHCLNRLSSHLSLTHRLDAFHHQYETVKKFFLKKLFVAGLTDWHVFSALSNKSGWICTLLLGRMQQCECKARMRVARCFIRLFDLFFFLCLFFSRPVCSLLPRPKIEFMFVHTHRGQGWPSEPRSLRPHHVWDDHRCPRCKDS